MTCALLWLMISLIALLVLLLFPSTTNQTFMLWHGLLLTRVCSGILFGLLLLLLLPRLLPCLVPELVRHLAFLRAWVRVVIVLFLWPLFLMRVTTGGKTISALFGMTSLFLFRQMLYICRLLTWPCLFPFQRFPPFLVLVDGVLILSSGLLLFGTRLSWNFSRWMLFLIPCSLTSWVQIPHTRRKHNWLLSNGVKLFLLVVPLLFGLCFVSRRLLLLIRFVLLGYFKPSLLLRPCSRPILFAILILFILWFRISSPCVVVFLSLFFISSFPLWFFLPWKNLLNLLCLRLCRTGGVNMGHALMWICLLPLEPVLLLFVPPIPSLMMYLSCS
mmetsp:Transcript_53142/g.110839  ORF Transcript_53142/g.110839 Transcript_53142/m.110839 type:complete len:330 (+) Transcript_53142:251-1240(+)